MEQRKEEFVKTLVESCACSREEAVKEVEESIHRLFHWAAYADKYGGNVQVGRETLAKFQDLSRSRMLLVGKFSKYSRLFSIRLDWTVGLPSTARSFSKSADPK